VGLLAANTIKTTPAEAIAELFQMRREPWFRKRLAKAKAHLERTTFRGRPLIHEPMSMAAIDAVLKEAWSAVKVEGDPLEQMMREMRDNPQ
jgi:hypothetical protein